MIYFLLPLYALYDNFKTTDDIYCCGINLNVLNILTLAFRSVVPVGVPENGYHHIPTQIHLILV